MIFVRASKAELAKIVEAARCRVIGADDASNDGHRRTVAVLIHAFNYSESALLCEPSLARKTTRPPDIVLIDPEVGVHVVEVKAISLDQIESMEAGGQLRIRYASGVRARNPVVQVRNAMFDIKDATARSFDGDLQLHFRYWIVFPSIRRSAWSTRFGTQGFCPPEYLFADDLEDAAALAKQLGASERHLPSAAPIQLCPLNQLECVWRAFGDTSVLYATPEDRSPRRPSEGTLGEQFDEAAEAYKQLSDEQQKLSSLDWPTGPRLVRGVAGSGKTIVLANNLARRLERMLIARQEGLFPADAVRPRLLAVCFNRTLAPYLQKKINIAFKQRTGHLPPEGTVEVQSFNRLMYHLYQAGLWKYQNVKDANEIVRALQYQSEVQQLRERDPARLKTLGYDAIYVDEGQDFDAEEFRLLKDLCRLGESGEPSLFIFYDDAQNLYGRGRPNWQSLGLSIRGRSHIMTQCFRNPRSIVEATFNVLYGTAAATKEGVPTHEYGDLATLTEKGLIVDDGGYLKVKFAPREGAVPKLTLAGHRRQETEQIIARLRWLIENQDVRPEDVMVLAYKRDRATQLADAIAKSKLAGVASVHVPFTDSDKDTLVGQEGRLTVSTVASAKGYDAYCVLLASANEFSTDVTGRASFYVGCTRAAEYLEVFAYKKHGLATEMEAVAHITGPQQICA